MPVPKAAMKKDNQFFFIEDYVGRARKITDIFSENPAAVP